MLRRAAVIVGGILILAMGSGCGTLEVHANQLGKEFKMFGTDVQDIFFGINPPEKEQIWNIYDE